MSVQENFMSPREFELIEYPGIVKNVDKMITTLGGMTKICQALGSEQKRLEVRYHPDNPFSKGAFGESNGRAGFLLSIKVRRYKNRPDKPPEYKVRILGHCKRIITFESLCDFQYLPMMSLKENDDNSPRQELMNALDIVMPKSVTDVNFFNNDDMPLLCLPFSFARSDAVHHGILRTDIQEDGQQDVLGVLQKSNYDNRDVIAFNMTDNFPARPDPQTLKRMKVKYVSDEQLKTVQKLFDKCPIWTRSALMYESGISYDKLKCIIPCVAYFFSSGPWRTLCVRYGYDPRKDFGSRFYQTFDFRLRFRSGVAEFVTRRSVSRKKNPDELNELEQDIDYPYFEENKLPRARQCILRYIDVHMPKVQEMLEKIPSPATGAVCNEKTGWLPVGFDAEVRQMVSNAIMELLKSHYRKGQIHAEVDSVENEENEEAANELEEDFDTSYDVNEYFNENVQNMFDEIEIENDLTP